MRILTEVRITPVYFSSLKSMNIALWRFSDRIAPVSSPRRTTIRSLHITREIITMHPLVNIAVSAVRQASRLPMHGIDKVTPTTKNPLEFLTALEVKAEQIMVDVIKAAYPEHAISAKQGGNIAGKDITWLIDSLDGSTNFLNGTPHFATTIAIIENGRVQHSVIYDPMTDELFTATRGRGASVNGRRLRVTSKKELNTCILGTTFPSSNENNGAVKLAVFNDFVSQCKDIRITGTASLDLAYLAAGRLDAIWHFGLSEWEISAASLMIQEAGGLIDDMNGQQKFIDKGDLIAASPKTFKLMAKTIQANLKK